MYDYGGWPMDAPVPAKSLPTKFDTDINGPISDALDAARRGDMGAAMQRLGIAATSLAPAAFSDQIKALDRALDQTGRGQLVLAAPDFAACSPLIDAVGLPDVCDFLAILRDLATGFSLRLAGDPAGALKCFETAMARADRLRFTFGNITALYLQGKVGANLARLTIAFTRGDIDEAETCAGKVQETYSDMEQAMGAAGSLPPAALVETLVTVIEAAFTFAEIDSNSLDYASALRRLKAASNAVARVTAALPALPNGPGANYVSATLAVFHVMELLVSTAASVISKREAISGDALKGLDQVYDLIFEAQSRANLAGEPGGMVLQMIRRLRRFADNLTAITKPKWRLADRAEGLVFGLSFVVLLAIEYKFVQPEAVSWTQWLLGDLIAALIVGFGPNALQFLPMLQLWSGVKDKAKAG
jgi:hypothetical protein